MNFAYSVPTLLTLGMIVGLFTCLVFLKKFFVTRLQGNWLGKAISRVGLVFIAATSVYSVLSFSKQFAGWDEIAHSVFVIASALQIGVFGSVAINQYVLTMIKRKAIHDPTIASMQGLMTVAAKATFFVFLFLLTLHNLGINITALVAGLGVGGIAIALAVQNLLTDLFASLTILLDKPFVVGDAITVGEFTGTLKKIGLKNSRLTLKTGETLIVANSDLLQSRVRNLATRKERLVALTIGVPYETSIEKLRQIPGIVERAILKSKNTRFGQCLFTQFGGAALSFETEYWIQTIDDSEANTTKSEINFSIVEALRATEIEIAYRDRPLYIQTNK